MSRLLPAIADDDAFYRERSRGVADWAPALQEISRRHSLPSGPVVRFADGESPVFALGEGLVVKLLPGFRAALAEREMDLLAFLAPHPYPPAPRLVAHGAIEDWCYLVMTRIAGLPLQHALAGIPPDQHLRLATAYGRLLAGLHALPQNALNPGAIDWPVFCRTSFDQWTARQDFPRVPPALQVDGPRYFRTHGAAIASAQRVLLHGDLAPVNLMVSNQANGWALTGMIDFGNAMRGDPWFDLTAASVLLQPGDRAMVHALLDGYAAGSSANLGRLRPALMANTMIHPLGNLRTCLDLVPGAVNCQTWDEVALRLWPD